jgi:hypothetical protein
MTSDMIEAYFDAAQPEGGFVVDAEVQRTYTAIVQAAPNRGQVSRAAIEAAAEAAYETRRRFRGGKRWSKLGPAERELEVAVQQAFLRKLHVNVDLTDYAPA